MDQADSDSDSRGSATTWKREREGTGSPPRSNDYTKRQRPETLRASMAQPEGGPVAPVQAVEQTGGADSVASGSNMDTASASKNLNDDRSSIERIKPAPTQPDVRIASAPVPPLPYRVRRNVNDDKDKWIPQGFMYQPWPSTVDGARDEVAKKYQFDVLSMAKYMPELWECDVNRQPTRKVAVDEDALLQLQASQQPQPPELQLLLGRHPGTQKPRGFVLFTIPAATQQPLTYPSAPPMQPVFGTLEELIVTMGGKRENGALQLNKMLEPPSGSFSTAFRGRTSELKLFAADIQAYKGVASSDRAEHHPFFVATALPGTGKTTFGLEAFARLPEYLTDDDTADMIRNGVTIYLNLNGDAYWRTDDKQLNAEARLVARIMATVFFERRYDSVWSKFEGLLRANVQLLEFRPLVSLIAAALRAKLGVGHDVKVSALFTLDEFQHLGGELRDAMRPILSTMGNSRNQSRCFDSDGILVVPLLTGLSLEDAKAVEVESGHKRKMIILQNFADSDAFAITFELMRKPVLRLPPALLDYFAPALDATLSFEQLSARQQSFRGLVLDCGGNPSLLIHFVRQLHAYCNWRFEGDSNEFLDGLFASFRSPYSIWHTGTVGLREKIGALPASLIPIVVASLPIDLDQMAVDGHGKTMTQTWSQLFSSYGLTPMYHPSFRYRWMVQMPYVYLYSWIRETAFMPLAVCIEFPYLYRSAGQRIERLVFKVHAQRTFHLLGRSALAIPVTAFHQLFPGAFVPSSLSECRVRLPNETAEREGGPQFKTENGWCHDVKGGVGKVDDIPPSALSGDVYDTSDINHYQFEGRSALHAQLDARWETWTTVLLLWHTKLSQPGSMTTFGLADICAWHNTARELTKRWTDAGVKVVFVLVLFRQLSSAAQAENAEAVYQSVRSYAQESGDLVVVTKDHMGEYLAGLAHRLHVPLEATLTASA